MPNQEFDLEAFIAGVNSDKTVARDPKEKLNKLTMNSKTNQGMVMFLPVYVQSVKNFYSKFPRVFEYYGETSKIDAGEGWFKVLPVEFYGELSPEDLELYDEVKSLAEYFMDEELMEYTELRVRNYAVFYGICMGLKNTEGKVNDKYNECPCIFIYPTNSVIDAFCTSLNDKIDAAKGNKSWIPMVLSPSNTGRQGVVMINCVKSAGPGYDVNVTFELNTSFNQVVDPNYVIEDKILEKFNDPLKNFIGWNYNHDENRYFDPTSFKELRDILRIRYKELTGKPAPGDSGPIPEDAKKVYDNKNNLTPGASAVSTSEAPYPTQAAPTQAGPTKVTPF